MIKKTRADDHALPSLALVFGYIAVKELQSLGDRIAVLTRLGYGNVEIAKICGANPDSVRSMKSRLGKSKKSRGRK